VISGGHSTAFEDGVSVARIKEAQLKEKPERRQWEEAPSFFKWTCGTYDHVKRARDQPDFSQRLEAAQAFRLAGNECFVEEKYDDALLKYVVSQRLRFHTVSFVPVLIFFAHSHRYSNAIAVFMWFQRRDDKYVDEVKLQDSLSKLSAPQMHQANEHLASCFLNAASVFLRQKEYRDAVYCCTKALDFKPGNAKAHFRRAQVCAGMWGRSAYHTCGHKES
jgi:tetratricopeptide (TPR) repeat protein